MSQQVTLAHACRLINHGPTVLVTSAHDGRRNVMAAAWSMPVEFSPPSVAVVIDKSTYTRELVLASGRGVQIDPQAARPGGVRHLLRRSRFGVGRRARVERGRWSFRADNDDLHTLHPLGGRLFAVPSTTIQARLAPKTS